jgi:hypothetical protein
MDASPEISDFIELSMGRAAVLYPARSAGSGNGLVEFEWRFSFTIRPKPVFDQFISFNWKSQAQ